MKGRQGIRRKNLLDDLEEKGRIMEIERGGAISQSEQLTLEEAI